MDPYTKLLQTKFGYDSFRDKQLEIVKSIIEDKRDVCAIMFTGAGKSLCYQFPAVYTGKISIIVSPLISLMQDQKEKMDDVGIPVCCLNSTIKNKDEIKEEIFENKYRLIYMAPEYLITQENFLTELVMLDMVESFCIDEAHCISTWGNDFRDAYKKLDCIRKWFKNIPIMCLTATATKKVQDDVVTTLKLKNPLIIKTTFNRPNLIIKILQKSSNKIGDLIPYIKKNEKTIIYCQTRKMTDKISEELIKKGYLCGNYHAGMTSTERESIQKKFADNELCCIVATVAFGMGIDAVIRKVIHYGIQQNMESYYQEIGRAGRDGLISECILFYTLSDMSNNNYFLNKISNISYRLRMIQLSLIMKKYVFSSDCRRKYILNYFGEEYLEENCQACDNCMKHIISKKVNMAKEAYCVFKTLNLTKNKYGSKMIIDILRGSASKKIPNTYKKSQLYGIGKNYSENWWKTIVTLLINHQYIDEKAISGGHGFSLSLSNTGIKWLLSYEKDKMTQLFITVPNGIDLGIKSGDTTLENKDVPQDSLKTPDLIKIKTSPKDDSKGSLKASDLIKIKTSPKDHSKGSLKASDLIKIKTSPKDDQKDNSTDSFIVDTTSKEKSKNIDVIYDLFQNKGYDVNKIAKELNLTNRTIENNIVKLYGQGKKLSLERIGFNDNICNTIQNKIKELNYPTELKKIRDELPRKINYFHIKLAQTKIEKNNDLQNNS